jgi:superkiller protein 3
MFAVLTVTAIGIIGYITIHRVEQSIQPLSRKVTGRIEQLWKAANLGIRDRKYLRAERALLTILKFDKRNAAAYSRLGIIYARQKEYKDAIECFEIASSIEPTASSLHNLGLIYYETEKYDKAGLAFENALELEDDLAARHIAYAKVQEKLGHAKKVVESLEKAVKLETTPQTLKLLLDAYESAGMEDESKRLKERIARLAEKTNFKSRRIRQPRRLIS